MPVTPHAEPARAVNPYPTAIIVKLIQTCNIACDYCYVYEHADASHATLPRRMTLETLDKLGRDLAAAIDSGHIPGARVVFHGGEPLMIGKRAFLAIVARLRAHSPKIELALQTNATLLDAQWAAILREERIAVSISVDGDRAAHDAHRVDKRGRGTYDRVRRGADLLQAAGVRFGALCVIDPKADGARTYEALRDIGASSFSFLLPDVSRDTRATFYPDVEDGAVARFLNAAFDVWLAEPGVVPISLFRDAVDRLTGGDGRTDAFGGEGLSYLIFETNGGYEVLDALKVCADGITKLPVEDDLDGIVARPEIARFVEARSSLPTGCRACRFARACRGGYLPHRYDAVRGFDNPSAWCADLYAFWTHVGRSLMDVARSRAAA